MKKPGGEHEYMEKLFYIGQFGEKVKTEDEKFIKEAEMFSTGNHRGMEYTEADIEELANSFSADEMVPLQLDHSESARDTVGFVREVKAMGSKLMGKVEVLDEAIQERINKGLMNKLSISFYLKETEEGLKPSKLREVSLVAFPQVKGARLFSENGYVSDYEQGGENSMTKENKQEFSEEVIQKAKEQLEEDLVNKYSELESKFEQLMNTNKKFAEDQIQNKIEKFQEEKKVVPAQAEALSKLMASFNEEQAELFEEFMKENKTVDLSEQAEYREFDENDKEKDQKTKEQEEFDSFYEQYAKEHGLSL